MLHLRWREGFRDATATAAAAGLAFFLAQEIFGHPRPVFAAIAAIICLAPGLPNHVRQAAGLMAGVAIGIVVGEIALTIPDIVPLARMLGAAFFSILIASLFGVPPVVPIQAGVSAVLVLAIGSDTAGFVRLADVAIGASVGLLFSQVLMTPDPLVGINTAAQKLLRDLAGGLRGCAEALRTDDEEDAKAALHELSVAHADLVMLGTGIQAARSDARWSVRGRLAAVTVQELAARYSRHAIRLYASSLLFAEALANALRKGAGPPPEALRERVLQIAERCEALAERGSFGPQESMQGLPPLTGITPEDPLWRPALARLALMEEALAAFGRDPRDSV
ncbi:aromatic acid exporter family protein [Methyloligella sp. GL2]|nr:aromatic acid exporter family protein [Methyloligella sp. GL2]